MPASKKKYLRIAMKEKRTQLFQQIPDAGHRIATLFFEIFDLQPAIIVGGYWPIGSELDVRPLLKKLVEKGFIGALPCITPQGLNFRVWSMATSLEKGAFEIFEPSSTSPIIFPHILLVPLLAFDKRGHRLGYGQGHYDRYLHNHPALTIGIGFKEQEIEEIPHQSHDFPLNYILTEEGLISLDN